MNSDSKVLRVITRKDPGAPGVLAEELAKASKLRAEKVAAAESEYAQKRGSVIERGVQRVREIRDLRAEIDAEEEALQSVVGEVE